MSSLRPRLLGQQHSLSKRELYEFSLPNSLRDDRGGPQYGQSQRIEHISAIHLILVNHARERDMGERVRRTRAIKSISEEIFGRREQEEGRAESRENVGDEYVAWEEQGERE